MSIMNHCVIFFSYCRFRFKVFLFYSASLIGTHSSIVVVSYNPADVRAENRRATRVFD
jgi:hypothetical protein